MRDERCILICRDDDSATPVIARKIRGRAEYDLESVLDIKVAAISDGKVVFDKPLRDVQDQVQMCIDKAVSVFRFNIAMPDPAPYAHQDPLSQNISRQLVRLTSLAILLT